MQSMELVELPVLLCKSFPLCTTHRAVAHAFHIKSQWSFVLHVTVQYLSAFNLIAVKLSTFCISRITVATCMHIGLKPTLALTLMHYDCSK